MSLKLHNDRSYARAVTALAKALRRSRDADKIPASLAEAKLNPGQVKLPGFHLFSYGGVVSPYEWLLPRPPGDESTMIYAYEAFADRPLGRVGRPGEIASAVFQEVGKSAGKRMGLDDETVASKWKHPALLLMGYAQKLTGEPVACGSAGTYSMHIAGAFMEVTPRGCFSNFRKATVPAAIPDNATVEHLFGLPGVVTGDPLVRTLWPLAAEVGDGALYALNSVACGLASQDLRPRQVLAAVTGKAAALGPRSYLSLGPSSTRTVTATLYGCDDAVAGLRSGVISDLQTLHDVLVPGAYTHRQFRVAFGDPEENPHRLIRTKTLLAWADRIETQAERLRKRNFNYADT